MTDAVGELMSLNGYVYANGNPVNLVDPSGMIAELPGMWASCVPNIVPVSYQQQLCTDPENPFCGLIIPGTQCPPDNPFCGFVPPRDQNCPPDNPYCWIGIIPSLPGRPFDQYTNAQLAAMCRQGNGVFNAACAELLRRCNQKVLPVSGDIDPCTGRNTCDPTRQAYHRTRKFYACKLFERKCTSATPCPVIYINITLIQNCLLARQAEVDECFQGIADQAHELQSVDEELALLSCVTEMTKTSGLGRPCVNPPFLPGMTI